MIVDRSDIVTFWLPRRSNCIWRLPRDGCANEGLARKADIFPIRVLRHISEYPADFPRYSWRMHSRMSVTYTYIPSARCRSSISKPA